MKRKIIPLDNYIVDFFCVELMLAIEVDGDCHDLKNEEDTQRQKKLECLGVKFLRFDNDQVKNNMNKVVQDIADWIDECGN